MIRRIAAGVVVPSIFVFILVSVFYVSAAWGADNTASLVNKTIDAYGGLEALKKASAIRQYGTVVSVMRGGAKGSLKRLFQRPAKLRVEVAFPGEEPEVRVLDGAKGWRMGQPVDGPPYQAMVLQAARLALPLNLSGHKGRIKELAPVARDGAHLRVLELPLGKGMVMTVEIDPETGLILRSSGIIKGKGKGAETIEFVTTYRDFRKVGGVLFPFAERNYAMGQVTGETKLDKVEVSAKLPAKTFAP